MKTLRNVLILSVLCSGLSVAQPLQSPAEFLGYELGDVFTPHHRVMDYYSYVAENSSRVELIPYGTTNEGRPLLVAVVSSQENMSRLDEIRLNNLKKARIQEGESTGFEKALVWLSYNVHGNESVSTEAALATLFDLADDSNTRTTGWLEDAVVILDPCINPDGRERYVNWYKQTRGAIRNVLPEAEEHYEPWPGGRANHYLFDLNRDWSWMTQVETQARLALYQQWMPHVHVDFHEQGVDSPYYFAPAAEPYHNVITDWQRELQQLIGENHARYFDANHWLYFTGEVFDLFYPGYGDTWPTYNGAIGMTYEQGGSGRAGLGIITAEGDTLTLRNRIDHHHTTSLSTIEVAAREQQRVLSEFESFFAAGKTSKSGYKAYVVKAGNPSGRLTALHEHLASQGIRVDEVSTGRSVRGFDYRTGETKSVRVDEGDWLVSLDQPRSVMADVLFEPKPNLVDSVTYDITAWALPYVFDLDAFALEESVAGRPLQIHQNTLPEGTPYAYLLTWKSFEDARFLADLLKEGVRVRYTTEKMVVSDNTFDPGSLILVRAGNGSLGDRFDTVIRNLATKHGVTLHPTNSGMVDDGPDFGSNRVRYIEPPRVLLLTGESTSSTATGEVWHYFDQQLEYPVTRVSADRIGGVDLDEYHVVILPNGSYRRVMNDAVMENITAWLRAGGTLIALEGATSLFVGREGFGIKQKEQKDEEKDADKINEEELLKVYGDRNREAQRDAIPGAIYSMQVDPTHPLGYGFGTRSYTLRRSDRAFAFLEDGWNVGVLRENGIRSGFAGVNAKQNLNEVLINGVESVGRGSVIYMADDPLFRGFWYAGRLLMANAIFMN